MNKCRSVVALVIALLVQPLSVIGVAPQVVAAAGACNAATDGNFHSGMSIAPGTVRGAEVLIDSVTETLCAGGGSTSFSSSWVSISGTGGKNEIFQVGFIKCQVGNCPSGTVYVWAYGREAGACGSAIAPTAHYLSSASAFSAYYRVERVFDPSLGLGYGAYVSGTRKAFKPASDLETCWANGPRKAQYMNEVGDTDDQSGGAAGDKQLWDNVKYVNSSGVWVSMNEPYGVACANHDLSTQKCAIHASRHDAFKTWDTRY